MYIYYRDMSTTHGSLLLAVSSRGCRLRRLRRRRPAGRRAALARGTLHEGTLSARGELHAAGRQVPLDAEATLRQVDGGLEVAATALVDHRELGMTSSPLGILRSPSKLIPHWPADPRLNERRTRPGRRSRTPSECCVLPSLIASPPAGRS